MGLARLERAQVGAAAGRGCARTVRAGSPTPAARSGTLKRADLSSSRCELDVTAPFHRRTKNSIWGLLACEPEHLLAQVHRPSLRSESRHLVMSQLWPLLRARSRRARHGHLHLHAGADRRLPGGGGRVAGDAERLCARAHGRSALPGTGRAVVPGGERSGNWSANRRAGAPQRKKRLLLSVVSFVESTRYFPFPSGARNRELTNRRGVQVYRGPCVPRCPQKQNAVFGWL